MESRLLFTVPTGFAESSWVRGLSVPTSMAFAPDGRLFVTEQGGSLRVAGSDGSLRPTPFATVPARSDGERGLLGVALDPSFASNGYVYVYWTNPSPRQHDTLSRFTVDPANPYAAAAGSRVDLLHLPDAAAGNHLGGAMHFGADGKLYLAVGEHGNPDWAQNLSNPFGKVLRLNTDGSFPADNPFVGQSGAYGGVWAYGLRNPFTFAVEAGTGRMHVNDVGSTQREEVNLGARGANFGWPLTEGKFAASSFPQLTNPLFDYVRSQDGCAITGGVFYRAPAGAARPWPAAYAGRYLYSDYCRTYVQALDPSNNFAAASPFAQDVAEAPVDLDVGPAGDVFVLSRGSEAAGAGSVVRISYTGSAAPSIAGQPQGRTVTAGQPASFTVSASGAAPLGYQWQRRNSGSSTFADVAGATSATYTLASASASDSGAAFRCVVSNSAGSATSNAATLTVTANQAPTATITLPAAGALYRAGETISFSGSGSDPEDGALPASAFTWSVVFHHDTHTHPALPQATGSTSGSYEVPAIGEASADVWYRVHLTVTDSAGMSHSTFRDVHPRTSQVTLATSPAGAGLSLSLDGTPRSAPYAFTGVEGAARTLAAPATQAVGGTTYEFVSWSDGGAREHSVSTPEPDTTYTATYRAVPTNAAPEGVSVDPPATADPVLAFRAFAAEYRDADGAQDVDIAYLRVRSASGAAFTAVYYAPQDALYVVADDGKTLLGGFAPGSANVIITDRGRLDCARTTVARAGDTATVTWCVAAASPLVGSNSVELVARDKSMAWSHAAAVGTWSVANPKNSTPTAMEVTPLPAADPAETFRTFTATYRDADGSDDIDIAYLRVRSSTGATLTAVYYSPTNQIFLVGEDGVTLLGGHAPGSPNRISNSLGTLDVSGTTLTRSGDTLTVTWRLAAAESLAGSNTVQVFARDRSRAWSAILDKGTWTITA